MISDIMERYIFSLLDSLYGRNLDNIRVIILEPSNGYMGNILKKKIL